MTLQNSMTTKMSKRDRLLSFLNLFGDESFTYFFLLNLVSNCTYAYTYHPFFAVFLMVCLSGSMALLEMFLFRILSKLGSLGKIYLLTIGTVYTIFILIDYFCLFNFQSTFDQDKLDILRETTPKETKEFLQTYLSFGLVLGGVACVVLLHIILFFISLTISKIKMVRFFLAIISTIGFMGWGFMVVSYIKFHNGFTIPRSILQSLV